MEHDNEIDSTPTGGLKLMTVFIIVLALHVLVIGGISAYHYFSHDGSDVVAGDATTGEAFTDEFASSGDFDNGGSRTELSPGAQTGAPAPAPATARNRPAAPANPGLLSPRDVMARQWREAPATPAAETTPAPAPAETVAAVETTVTETVVAAAPASTGAEYVVQKGDTLWRVARKNDTTVAKIKEANHLTSDVLQIGQKLVVPAPQIAAAPAPTPAPVVAKAVPVATPAPAVQEVVATETTDATTVVYGSPDADLPVHSPAPVKVTSAPAPADNGSVYKVAAGDTLWRIAKKFKTTPDAIMSANGISDPTKLRVGAKLVIPENQQAAARPATAPQSRAAAPAPITDIVLNN